MTPLKSTIVPRPRWVIFNLSILLLHYGANIFIEAQENILYFQSSRKYKLKSLTENKKLTGLLPVPTGSLSSSVGGGRLWKAQILDRHSNHLLAFSAIHAP